MAGWNRNSFSVEDVVGIGGVGIVESVWHPEFEIRVARKRLNEVALIGPERDRNKARFRTEVAILQERLNHPNVIKVLAADLEDDDPWFIMEWASASLESIIPPGGLPINQVLDLFLPVLDGIEHAHGQGILHRDIKAGNVLLIDDRVVVSDFGLGRHIDSSLTRHTTSTYFGGSAGYVSPEQVRGFGTADYRSDIYSLGSLLFIMLTGESPEFYAPRLLPLQFRSIVERCRERNPDHRYQSVAELRLALTQVQVFAPPEKTSVELARELIAIAPNNQQILGELVGLYLGNADDNDLFATTLPEWTSDLISSVSNSRPHELREILTVYCDQLPGKRDFSYLDTAASMLARIFGTTTDPLTRETIMRRMLEMAVNNNRFAVGRIFVRLVEHLKEAHDRELAYTILVDDPNAVAWLFANVSNSNDVALIRDVRQQQKAARSRPPTKNQLATQSREQIRTQVLYLLYDRYQRLGETPACISEEEVAEAVTRLAVSEADIRTAFRELVADGLAYGHSSPGTEMSPEDGFVWLSAAGRRYMEGIPATARFSQKIREEARKLIAGRSSDKGSEAERGRTG